jgi:hypothetical protein
MIEPRLGSKMSGEDMTFYIACVPIYSRSAYDDKLTRAATEVLSMLCVRLTDQFLKSCVDLMTRPTSRRQDVGG